jgi:hypothetical protein
MFVCCVLSGRGLCDEPITRPEESYRLWCIVVCDLETSKKEEAMTHVGSQRHRKNNNNNKCANVTVKVAVSCFNDLLVTVAKLIHIDEVSCNFCICLKHTLNFLVDT